MSENLSFAVRAQGATQAKTIVATRNFQLVIDEPESLGGNDEGPNPVEFLLASFAGCINVVAHIVAKEQKFQPKDLKIDIEGKLNPNRLFGKSLEFRAGYSSINVQISTTANIDEGQRLKWLKEIEARCPINDNLLNTTPVNIEIRKTKK